MRSLAELGIGLSVVFGIFVLALLAELCYIFYWKKSGSSKSSSADCIKSAREIFKPGNKLHHSSAEFVREASLVGSFGGYPASIPTEVGGGSDYADQAPHLLFPIEEETKEDLELAAGSGGTTKPNSRLRNRTPSDVLTIHFTSGSTSPAASVDTSFTTPPSSPPPPPPALAAKLSPYAARAVRQISCSDKASSSPVGAEMYAFAGAAGCNGRMPLQLLFERSPLLEPGAHMPSSSFPSALSMAHGKGSSKASSPPPPFYHRLSLAALFGQSPIAGGPDTLTSLTGN